MDNIERVETVEIDADHWIQLEFGRRWPKYVVDWSVRRRAGEGDFPIASGASEGMPPRDGGDMDALWDDLRTAAVEQARTAWVADVRVEAEAPKQRSLLNRLLGRD